MKKSIPFHVRPATHDDLVDVVRIESACAETPHWSSERYAEILLAETDALQRRVLLVAEREGCVIGFAVGAAVANESEMESIAVSPEARRQGAGRALCEALVAWAGSHDAKSMWLEVRSANVGAQALYRELGFVESGRRKKYYADPVEDAIVMRRSGSRE